MTSGITDDSGAEIKPISIFICSSGDMIAERQAALRVIEALNRAARGAARLEAYLWEENIHRFQGAQSYQGNIPLPAGFDIFLGFLFSRIGSRLTEQEYRRDIQAKLANLTAGTAPDGADARDPLALTQLTADLPAEALPTGTTFEIINARDATQRPGGDGRPCLWLAVNSAIPDGMNSRDRTIAEPVRQRWYEVARFVTDELNARHLPVSDYGADVPRAQQLKPGGLQEFEDKLEAWLTNTLATRFAVRLSWAERAYVGLRPFRPEEAPIFLGRRASIGEALGQFDQRARLGKATMLLLTGPSGAGKSSFARAGLIGHLGIYRLHRRRAEGSLFVEDFVRTWRYFAVRPADLGDDPAGGILTRLGILLGASDAFAPLAGDLAALPFSGTTDIVTPALAERLRAVVQRRLAGAGPSPALFLLLDQLEDLLATDRTAATRRLLALLQVLAECAERNVWIVVAIADQWRSALGSAGLLAALEGADRFALPPPRLGELREIIEVPARRAGLLFEQGPEGALDQTILNDLHALSLHSEAPLPLLQVALARLEDRKEGGLLTFVAYRAMGGVTGAIREHARAALAEWQTAERRPVLERLLFRLVQRDSQQRIVCRLAPRAELEAGPEMRALEEHLVAPEWRLLQGHNERDTEGAIRIAHDVLLDHADAFRAFVETERDNVILLADAQDDAGRWVSEGRPPALLNHHLPSVERLQTLLLRLAVQAKGQLAEFASASREEIGRVERERDAALLTRSRLLAGYARQQNEEADFGTALALALEAIPHPDGVIDSVIAPEALVELDRAVRSRLEVRQFDGHEGIVVVAVFDPSGQRVLTASDDHTARLWDAATGAELAILRGHEDRVVAAVFNASGSRVVTVSNDKTARLWNVATGAELAILHDYESWIKLAMFDPSGSRLLITRSDNRTAWLLDAEAGLELAMLRGHEDAIVAAVFNPSGLQVVTASNDHTARVWDAANGAELAVLRGHEARLYSAVFDPSGEHVLTASEDGTARLWVVATGVQVAVFRGHDSDVITAVFDRSGKRVLTGSADQTARLWEISSNSRMRRPRPSFDWIPRRRSPVTETALVIFRGHEGPVTSAVFDPSGTRVLTLSTGWIGKTTTPLCDLTARLWDLGSGTELAVLRGDDGRITTAVFDPSGAHVLTASADRMIRLRGAGGASLGMRASTSTPYRHAARVWDAATGDELSVLRGHNGGIGSAVFDPAGRRVLTASDDNTARLWNPGSAEPAIRLDHDGAVTIAVFDPSGTRVMTASDLTARLSAAATGVTVGLLNHEDEGRDSGAFFSGSRGPALIGGGKIVSAVFDKSGERVLTASEFSALLWDVTSGTVRANLTLESRIRAAALAPTGAHVLTTHSDHTVHLWEAGSGAQVAVLRGHQNWIQSALFNPSGTRVITASADNTARLWDAATGAELAVLRHPDAVWSAMFDPAGTRILTAADDHTVRLWDADSGAELVVMRGDRDEVVSTTIVPERAIFDRYGRRVLSTAYDHTARLWDATNGAALGVLRGHQDSIRSAVFDSSGVLVLTASDDATARLWDAKTGAELAVLRGHKGSVLSAVFDPSGTLVLTASDDKTARIWRVFPTVAGLVAHARAVMPRPLTQEQRKQFFLE